MGIRTPDIQLAKLALYQLSYTPLFTEGRPCPGLAFDGLEEKDRIARCVPSADRAEYI